MESENDRKTENGLMSVKYKEQMIELMYKYYSATDLKIAQNLEQLADIYKTLQRHDGVLINLEKALEIRLQEVDPRLSPIIAISQNITNLYIKHRQDFQSALQYQLINHKYTLEYNELKSSASKDSKEDVEESREKIAGSHIGLADLYLELQQYDSAIEHLEIAMTLYKQVKKSFEKQEAIEEKVKSIKQQQQ
ncbi:unnamed protein product [Didymodactylos carnosus]|uniref:Tetratricopeptide repeat protein n=2 Tax=Didymodactylos carnosus TaxID=1234261 RepID=A0A815SEC7_9BILA|nr:unnamed protein product [Didymodactylos carnosus]CAF4352789.1 unnamed protein product [Didymodactylos carnosus]